jgi:dTDP-4-dehydrorhamnose 3,5-epimerase
MDPPMKVVPTELPEVVLLEPKIYEDRRGITYESFNQRTFREATGLDVSFVQENRSRSVRNTIRGVHYQLGSPQGKLVGVLSGEIFDVAVDLRRSSPRFGRWTGFHLASGTPRYAWIPSGFGHAFLALTENVEVIYKMSEFWAPNRERVIRWNDADLRIQWPLNGEQPVLSKRDAEAVAFKQAEVFE